MNRLFLLLLLGALACGNQDPRDTALDDTDVDSDTVDPLDGDPGPLGFVGSPCETVSDCSFDGAVCLTDGYGLGMCSQGCDLYCPDRDGHPTTFCVDGAALDGHAASLGDGACHTRCDFGFFPDSGCRPGYGCVVESRANEPDTLTYVCLPDAEPELSPCHFDLADRGVAFEPTVVPDQHPSENPSLTCHVQDAVRIKSPVNGVTLKYYDGSVTPTVLAACTMGLALADTIDDVKSRGAVALRHIGTYNCRPIAGTSTLSRHSYADAIDIYGFEMSDGDLFTLIDDWEYDATPSTEAGTFLWEAAYRWHDARYWSIILTPDYNSAHANHFHVDLTPGGDFINFARPGVRPMPFEGYDDPFGNTW